MQAFSGEHVMCQNKTAAKIPPRTGCKYNSATAAMETGTGTSPPAPSAEAAAALQIPRAGEEATILFHSLPSRIFDSINDRIDAALRNSIETGLPFLPEDMDAAGRPSIGGSGDVDIGSASGGTKAQRPPEKLLSILRNLYGTNLDIAEAYACRNVFALPVGTGPKRREEIVKAYLAGGVDQEGAGAGQSTNADGTSSASASAASQHAIPPNKEAIPTPEQIAAIDEETAALRKKLRDVRRKRSDLRAVVSKLGQTHGLAKGAKRALDESCLGDKDGAQAIHESVSSAVAGREDLKALTEAGKDLMTKLDEEKEARKNGGADNDDDGVVDLNDGAAGGGTDGANAEPLSIEEDMERRKKIMRTGEKDELTKVSVLLKEK